LKRGAGEKEKSWEKKRGESLASTFPERNGNRVRGAGTTLARLRKKGRKGEGSQLCLPRHSPLAPIARKGKEARRVALLLIAEGKKEGDGERKEKRMNREQAVFRFYRS